MKLIKAQEEDHDLDHNEAAFAMIETLWAMSDGGILTLPLFPTQPYKLNMEQTKNVYTKSLSINE